MIYLCFKQESIKSWLQPSAKARHDIDNHSSQPDIDDAPDVKGPS